MALESVGTADLLGPAELSRRAAERFREHGISPGLRRLTSALGGFYLTTAGVNVGLALARPHLYDAFGDHALLGWVRTAWHATFAVHPVPWAGALAAGELLVGVALLNGGRWAVAGYAAVVAFHLALLCFGFWAWPWALPVLALVVPAGVTYARHLRAAGRR